MPFDNCYAVVSMLDKPFGEKIAAASLVTLSQRGNIDPVWLAHRCFPVKPLDSDCLRVEVWDDGNPFGHTHLHEADEPIGVAHVPMSALRAQPETSVWTKLKMSAIGRSRLVGDCHVAVRLVYDGPMRTKKLQKTVFLVRHGESKW